MAPTPDCKDEDASQMGAQAKREDEICITGLAGSFPDSDSVFALRDNLFNKVDLISDDDRRWKMMINPDIPRRTGKINNINRFDAAFFEIDSDQAHTMDPAARVFMEKTFEAIIDAGVHPSSLRGTKTGVFIGTCGSESEKTWFYQNLDAKGSGILGCSRAMLANRISNWLGCNGFSYTVDSACSSSMYALEHAYRAMRDGHCTAAIVGGANLCLHPSMSLQFARLGVLSPVGQCRSFDKDAAGYVRSEAIVVIFLQKAKDAKRVYAQVVHAKTNCDGYKPQGITYPAGNMQKMLLREFYDECKINPHDLEFIEAHGTGTIVGDPEELKALDEIFCTGRSEPLLVGAVKSNMGHAEPASGLCSIAKMCIAYDTGFIPPNINYGSPRKGILALEEGRMVVVTEKTPWNRGMTGINSFGFGGANSHVLLRNFSKPKINGGIPRDDLPRLVCVSGRSESAVNRLLDDVESRPVDAEYVRLLHAIHEFDIAGHVRRGFTILRSNKDIVRAARETQHFPGAQRPVWFVFSGMGSQWAGMGTQLMRIPIFAAAIERCHHVLKPRGIDIATIITDPNPKIFDNILHSFVGIAAIQIGLCDILKELGIVPDNIIGHGVGELGCAYADGCFTAEQMILAAYSRGLASIEAPFIKGSMAAVGVGYEEVKNLCPPDIEVACHNGPDSSTISGPADVIKDFVAQLQARGIFAEELPCSNIAYHSRYIAEAGPTLLKYLNQVIPEPVMRSSRWVSSSVPQHLWNEKRAQYCSAEYHTNNLLSPVLFEETSRLIPGNAVTIEIAPHGLLQATLKRSLEKDCINLPLTKKGHIDNVEFLLTSIGKLFEVGLNPNLANIYPKVEFPVSSGTPMISHLVEWEHSEDWYVALPTEEKLESCQRTVQLSLIDEDMDYMAGHVVDGRNLFPATGYLMLVWETLAMMMGVNYIEVSVVFENVCFQRATNIPKEGSFEFIIMIQTGSGNFEIAENDTSIVTGKIYHKKDVSNEYRPFEDPPEETGPFAKKLTSKDVYKELRLRGYNYSGLFKGIQYSNQEGNRGYLKWCKNWVTFVDTMLQMKILGIDTRGLYVPTRIEKISIDTTKHYASAMLESETSLIPVDVYEDIDIIRSGGVEIRGLHAAPIIKRNPPGIPVLEKYEFIPNISTIKYDLMNAIRICVQILLENMQIHKVKVVELIDSATLKNSVPLVTTIGESLEDLPLIQSDKLVISEDKIDLGTNIAVENKKISQESNVHLFVGSKLMGREEVLNQILRSLKENGYILSRESSNFKMDGSFIGVEIVAVIATNNETLVLTKKTIGPKPTKFVFIKDSDEKFTWIDQVKTMMKEVDKLVLVAQNEKLNGILGLVNCLRKEPGGEVVKCLNIVDPKAPKFDPNSPFYKLQLDKNLAINVFKDGQWGTYRHLILEELNKFPSEHAYINVTARGDLSSLKWIEGPLRVGHDEKLSHVYYSALNFRDVMTSTNRISVETVARGRMAQQGVLGLEYSGRSESGYRVMGMLSCKGLANVVNSDPYLLWPVPDEWSLEDAVTVPVAYGTVFYSLFTVGHLKPGESILIHAGSGGVGQAAIHVCLYYECNIFTTVGTPEKREFIKKLFPQLKDSHIGNSRDTSFEEMIKKETNGKGVDLVLNSLAEEKLQASVRCLGNHGRFLEIGKFDLVNNSALGMQVLAKGVSFHGVMLDLLFERSSELKQELGNLVYEGIRLGCVKPLSRIVFGTDEVEKAFRYMAAGKHVGKVLIKIRDEETDMNKHPEKSFLEAIPKYIGYPEISYVVCGGLGGFGLELTDWLVLQGAKKIVLNSRRGLTTGYQCSRIRAWRVYGVEIMVNTDDITTQKGCSQLLKAANKMAPVHAIFNLAVILKDALFENQTAGAFAESFAPKARATKFLDIESRKLCPNLSEFVVFSSVSCGRGNAGQTNYGMANAIMERICEERKKDGFPAVAIQWGAVGDVGLVADMQEEQSDMEIGGTLPQRISSCLSVLDQFLKHSKHAVLASMVVAEKKTGGYGCGTIVDAIAGIMAIKDLKTVSHKVTLAELGMDSIMAVEIKQCLEREFEIFLTPKDIRTLTLAKLQELSSQRETETSTSTTINNTTKVSDRWTGLKMLMKNIGTELTASEPIVNMATMIEDGQSDLICNSEPFIFMIPGIEGMAGGLESLCKRLKFKVTVLQLGYDNPKESVIGIAERLSSVIRSRLAPGATFTLLGYSFGCIVALEVARVLESEGHEGHIFCVDGAPDFLNNLLKINFNPSQEDILQNALLTRIMDIIAPNNQIDIVSKLSECITWDSKIEEFLLHVPDTINHSKQYQRALSNAVYGRLKAIINYDGTQFKKLKSPTTLFRPMDCPPGMIIDENYELHKYIEQPVKVHCLESNHVTIIDNEDCANIINGAMSDLLKEGREKTIVDINGNIVNFDTACIE